jgi:hypothetical protein
VLETNWEACCEAYCDACCDAKDVAFETRLETCVGERGVCVDVNAVGKDMGAEKAGMSAE